jgi:hypothetical protein
MELQEMEITIDREGRINVKVRGAHGSDCLVLTKDLENTLGVVEHREYTTEYYQQPSEIREYQNHGQ